MTPSSNAWHPNVIPLCYYNEAEIFLGWFSSMVTIELISLRFALRLETLKKRCGWVSTVKVYLFTLKSYVLAYLKYIFSFPPLSSLLSKVQHVLKYPDKR